MKRFERLDFGGIALKGYYFIVDEALLIGDGMATYVSKNVYERFIVVS